MGQGPEGQGLDIQGPNHPAEEGGIVAQEPSHHTNVAAAQHHDHQRGLQAVVPSVLEERGKR